MGFCKMFFTIFSSPYNLNVAGGNGLNCCPKIANINFSGMDKTTKNSLQCRYNILSLRLPLKVL